MFAPSLFLARCLAHAASSISMLLSGFILSWMYLALNSAELTIASLIILTLWNSSNRLLTPVNILTVVS